MAEEKEVQVDEVIEEDSSTDVADAPTEETVPLSQLKATSAEAAKWRKELRALQKTVESDKKEREQADMTEQEALKAQLREAEATNKAVQAQANKTAKRAHIMGVASELNFRSPGDAAALIDTGAIDVDDEGNVSDVQVRNALETLAAKKDYLVNTPGVESKSYGPGNPAPRPEETVAGKTIYRGPVRDKSIRDLETKMARSEITVADYFTQHAIMAQQENKLNPTRPDRTD